MDELANVMLIAEQLYTMCHFSVAFRSMAAVEEGVPGEYYSVRVLSYFGGFGAHLLSVRVILCFSFSSHSS